MGEPSAGDRVMIPSGFFPAFPEISLPQPEGWQPVAVPGAYLGVSHPGDSDFTPTVLVTVERWMGTVALAVVLETQRVRMRAAGQRESGAREQNGEVFLHAEQRDAQLGCIELRYRIRPLPRGGVTDVVTVVGTASWRQMPGLGEQIDVILAGAEMRGSAGEGNRGA